MFVDAGVIGTMIDIIAAPARSPSAAMQWFSGVELQAMIGARDRGIEHAIDCIEKPMTDKRLETMFADLMDGIIPTQRSGVGWMRPGTPIACRAPWGSPRCPS